MKKLFFIIVSSVCRFQIYMHSMTIFFIIVSSVCHQDHIPKDISKPYTPITLHDYSGNYISCVCHEGLIIPVTILGVDEHPYHAHLRSLIMVKMSIKYHKMSFSICWKTVGASVKLKSINMYSKVVLNAKLFFLWNATYLCLISPFNLHVMKFELRGTKNKYMITSTNLVERDCTDKFTKHSTNYILQCNGSSMNECYLC